MALAALNEWLLCRANSHNAGKFAFIGGGDCGECRRRRRGRAVLAAPNPLTVALLAIFYSPSLE
ncbi:hypothetical protein LNP74_28310 [Klebsiella pneumoniae subsp. pneumoniae]|nr:hypothetical protein [Klebsiella pneumoniae subsp. pneumoniae]